MWLSAEIGIGGGQQKDCSPFVLRNEEPGELTEAGSLSRVTGQQCFRQGYWGVGVR